MPNSSRVAERLRALRAARSLKQEDIARMAKVTPKTVSKWEKERTEPSASHILNLCAALGVSADYVLGRVDSESMLKPGHFLIDLDEVDRAKADPSVDVEAAAFPIPSRSIVMSLADWKRERARILGEGGN